MESKSSLSLLPQERKDKTRKKMRTKSVLVSQISKYAYEFKEDVTVLTKKAFELHNTGYFKY